MDNRTLSPLQRVFLWNQLSFNLKHFDLFGFEIQTGDQKNAQNNLRSKIKYCLTGKNINLIFNKDFFNINSISKDQTSVNNAMLIQIWNFICFLFIIFFKKN